MQIVAVHIKDQSQTVLLGKDGQEVEGKTENAIGIGGARIRRKEVGALRENELTGGIGEKKKERKRKGHVNKEEDIESENHIVVVVDVTTIVMEVMDEPLVVVFRGKRIIAIRGTKMQEAEVVLATTSGESPLMIIHSFYQKRFMTVKV